MSPVTVGYLRDQKRSVLTDHRSTFLKKPDPKLYYEFKQAPAVLVSACFVLISGFQR